MHVGEEGGERRREEGGGKEKIQRQPNDQQHGRLQMLSGTPSPSPLQDVDWARASPKASKAVQTQEVKGQRKEKAGVWAKESDLKEIKKKGPLRKRRKSLKMEDKVEQKKRAEGGRSKMKE